MLETTPYVVSALEHSAQLFRQNLMNTISGTGVVGPTDLEVTEHSPANLSVNVAPGYVIVPGTQGSTTGQRANAGSQHSTYSSLPADFTSQGVYDCVAPSITNMTLSEANPTNPRIDLICASVQDAQYSGSFNQALLQVVTGTPAGSPSPPAPPENTVVLAQVAVAAKATKIEAANITSERPVSSSGGLYAWGAISEAGAIEAGTTNFTVSKIATGNYELKWKPELTSAAYGVIAMAQNATARTSMSGVSKTAKAVDILFNHHETNAAENAPFAFVMLYA
jgi:hypothetical protein